MLGSRARSGAQDVEPAAATIRAAGWRALLICRAAGGAAGPFEVTPRRAASRTVTAPDLAPGVRGRPRAEDEVGVRPGSPVRLGRVILATRAFARWDVTGQDVQVELGGVGVSAYEPGGSPLGSAARLGLLPLGPEAPSRGIAGAIARRRRKGAAGGRGPDGRSGTNRRTHPNATGSGWTVGVHFTHRADMSLMCSPPTAEEKP